MLLDMSQQLFSKEQVSKICSERRTKSLYMALVTNYTKVAPDDLQAARDAVTFALDWKAGNLFPFEEPSRQAAKVIELQEKYQNLVSA